MFHLINRKGSPRKLQRRQRPRWQPRLEGLEGRALLSSAPSFAAVGYTVTGNTPRGVAVGDLNGDGHLDLVTANSNSSDVNVLLGNGDGTFGPEARYTVGAGPWSVAVGDFNGDHRLDLVTANTGSGDVSVLLGNGDGTFGRRSATPSAPPP